MIELSDEIVEGAVRASCGIEGADIHLVCTYPKCSCKKFPKGVRASLSAALPAIAAAVLERAEYEVDKALENGSPMSTWNQGEHLWDGARIDALEAIRSLKPTPGEG